MALELEIEPVAYERINEDWLPGKHPYPYQWMTYQLVQEAIANNETLCLFLVTPTGSGKTIASYAYSIRHGQQALGIYPTNELIRDQERSLAPMYRESLGWENWVLRVDSEALDQWGLDLNEPRHSQALETLLSWQHVLLTNPDILFYIAFGRYLSGPSGQRQRLLTALASTYRLMVFDEFHLYNVKQMADVAFLVGALQAIHPEQSRIYIFASATPNLEIIPQLRDNLGIRVEILKAEPSPAAEGHTIAYPLHLTLLPADLQRWQGPKALAESQPLLDAYLEKHPQARIVTIMESVAGAINAAQQFRMRYPQKSVGEIHGLSSNEERQEALRRDITVGTATIEVGIDFKEDTEKDILIFEAHTASKFLQRFGRLARHPKRTPIPNYVLAFVPPYVYHFFQEKVSSGHSLSRAALNGLIAQAYDQPETFGYYVKKHAPAEFYAAKSFIRSGFQPDVRARILDRVGEVIQALTGKKDSAAGGLYHRYHNEGILEALLTFRGASFQAALLDRRETDLGFPAKRYDLMFILRRGLFEEITAEEYQAYLQKLETRWPEQVTREQRYATPIKRDSDQLLGVYGYFVLNQLLEEGRKVWFEIERDEVWNRKAQVTVVQGLRLATDPPTRLHGVNRLLRRKQIVAWFVDKHPLVVKLSRALPHLFALYELRVLRPGGAQTDIWTIAFNQDAFFLDSLNWYFEQRQSEAIIL